MIETPPSADVDVTQAKCSPAKERGERHQETVETGFIWLTFQLNLLALPLWPDEDDGIRKVGRPVETGNWKNQVGKYEECDEDDDNEDEDNHEDDDDKCVEAG